MSCGIIPCVTVNTGTVALIEQFGKFTKIAKPGLNVVIPCFCEFPAATVNPTTDLITLARSHQPLYRLDYVYLRPPPAGRVRVRVRVRDRVR